MKRVLVALLLIVVASAAEAQRGGGPAFPHDRHERLFPLCESCHAGIVSGDARTVMPDESSCRTCHNGTDVPAVNWQRPVREAGLLRFAHTEHARLTDSTGRSCATCHGASVPSRMPVTRATPESCLGCHTHRASTHLGEDNRCAVCHVPLTGAPALSRERIAALPKPASHERSDFISTHKPASTMAAASCAICHARESCARCHVNAGSEPLIASLGRDERVAGLMRGKPASYPVPADHQSGDFMTVHGELASAGIARCSSCHARPSCRSCHIGSLGASVIDRVPEAERGGATGVLLEHMPPRRRTSMLNIALADTTLLRRRVTVHPADFRLNHRAATATQTSCAGCHEKRFCSDCHAGEGTRRFHPANFVQRHVANSYGRETQCASCHNTELFCRSCHQQSGLSSRGRLNTAFHDAQPQWLLQHGRAARQGMESCATCHAQRDCLACHSTLGWGVNPHGPGFQAGRMAARAPTQCLLCHLRVPGR